MPRRSKNNRRQERPIILVLSEDSSGVFKFLKQSLSFGRQAKVSFLVKPIGEGPKKLFQIASKAVKGKQRGMPHAEAAFLVFDKDNDPNFEAILSKAHGITNIYCFTSSPCVEYFFLLHFTASSRPFNNYDEIFHELKNIEGFERYHKGDGGVPVALLAKVRGLGLTNTNLIRVNRRAENRKMPHTDIDVLFRVCSFLAEEGIEALKDFDFSDLICSDEF